MTTSSDPTETADIDTPAAIANHLDRLARMAEPFGYELIETAALEALRADAFEARLHRIAAQRAAQQP